MAYDNDLAAAMAASDEEVAAWAYRRPTPVPGWL